MDVACAPLISLAPNRAVHAMRLFASWPSAAIRSSHPLLKRCRLPHVPLDLIALCVPRARRLNHADLRGPRMLLQVLLPTVRRLPGAGLRVPTDARLVLPGLRVHHVLLGCDPRRRPDRHRDGALSGAPTRGVDARVDGMTATTTSGKRVCRGVRRDQGRRIRRRTAAGEGGIGAGGVRVRTGMGVTAPRFCSRERYESGGPRGGPHAGSHWSGAGPGGRYRDDTGDALST